MQTMLATPDPLNQPPPPGPDIPPLPDPNAPIDGRPERAVAGDAHA